MSHVNDNNDDVVFLEPSCGDGRLISKLLQSISEFKKPSSEKNKYNRFPYRVIGYDVDPIVIEKSRKNLHGTDVILRCKDFLSLRKRQFLSETSHVDHSTNITNNKLPQKKIRLDKPGTRFPDFCEKAKLIVFGGPPYTPKSLPERFILHSIQELHAEIVVFILPERCRNDAVKIQKILNSSELPCDKHWCYVTKDLTNSSFSFQHAIVTQPSILQYWHKN